VSERRIYNGSSTRETLSFRERSIKFVLDRVIHDFSNAIGGIVTLTDHHLQYDQQRLDPRLSTSLQMIYDSAERCRALLGTVSGVFDPGMNERVYVHADDLAVEVGQLYQALLPRSVRFTPLPPCSQSAVRVRPSDFKARWLAIASLDCRDLKETAQVEFGCTVQDDLCWFRYRSSNGDKPDLSEASRILLPLTGAAERTICRVTEHGWVAGVALPLALET
jgi:hypothetical protein